MGMQKRRVNFGVGKILGFIFAYIVFSFIMYFILSKTHKLPADWGILHIYLITGLIAAFGIFLRRIL